MYIDQQHLTETNKDSFKRSLENDDILLSLEIGQLSEPNKAGSLSNHFKALEVYDIQEYASKKESLYGIFGFNYTYFVNH